MSVLGEVTLQSINQFSIKVYLEENNVNTINYNEFNFSSKSQIDKLCVAFLKNKENEHVQCLYSKKELMLTDKANEVLSSSFYQLNKDYSPREFFPFGKFIYLQPFAKFKNLKTLISKQILESEYLIISDLSKLEDFIIRTEDLVSNLDYIEFELREKSFIYDTKKITITKGLDAIEKVSKDKSSGSIFIRNSHIESISDKSLKLDEDIFIPFFPRTIEEILVVNGENSFIDSDMILEFFSIDHLVETAYLIQAHKAYPELENHSISMAQIINYVGYKESYDWLYKMAKRAEDKRSIESNEDFMNIYFKFAKFINVASEICSMIVSHILDKEPHLPKNRNEKEKIKMVSRLINFPSVLLAANTKKENYQKVMDHIAMNPTHNSLEICDAVLGYNEIDMVTQLFKDDCHIPEFIKVTLLEQYNPMYNASHSIYPNINYIASNLMKNNGIIQSSIFAPSKKVAYVLAQKLGISLDTILEIEEKMDEFKLKAINKNKIHEEKKIDQKEKINALMTKYSIPFFGDN